MASANTSSQTYQFWMSNSSIVAEAYERCGKQPSELSRHHWISARRSLSLVLAQWATKGTNLWKVMGPSTINLQVGVANYNMPTNAVSLLDVYYSTPGGGGTNAGGYSVDQDRLMEPIGRSEWAAYPNKKATGIPTVYWYDKLSPVPNITLYQAPIYGFPSAVVKYYWLSRMQDADVTSGQAPDVPYTFLEPLCADLALALARKPTLVGKLPPDLFADIKANAAAAWELAATTDREDVPIRIQPQLSGYFRS